MLTQPFTLPCGLTLSNRISKASMTEALADDHDHATSLHSRLYRTWSEGGAGLLLTGNVMVDGRYLERPGNVVVEDESGIDALRAWAADAQSRGNACIMQISHPGRQTPWFVSGTPVAPSAGSAVAMLGSFAAPRALETDEIEDIIARFGRTAAIAERAGFSGVQIHGAHGYLVSQFLSPITNRRTDHWGGSLENRARFLLEILRTVRRSVRPGFAVAVKLNSADFQRGGFDADDALTLIGWLEREGVDFVEISGGNYESPGMFGVGKSERTVAREAYFLEFARRVRTVSKIPLMVTGGFRTRQTMLAALEEGALDLVGMARPLAFEPDLPARLLDGRSTAALRPSIRPPTRRSAALAEGAWFGEQIVAVASGHAPDPGMSVLGAMLVHVGTDLSRGLSRQWRRRGLVRSQAAPLVKPAVAGR